MADTKDQAVAAGERAARKIRRHARFPLVTAWVIGNVAGVAAIWLAAAHGAWFGPLIVGAVIGAMARLTAATPRRALLMSCLTGLAGWTLPLAWLIARGQPVVATARVVAALAGLAPSAVIVLAATLLIALLQAGLGTWLGWSLERLADPR